MDSNDRLLIMVNRDGTHNYNLKFKIRFEDAPNGSPSWTKNKGIFSINSCPPPLESG
jgi:hypothetical protein